MTSTIAKCVRFLLEANFCIAVIVLIGGAVLSMTGAYEIFEFNEDLYGALANNLRVMMFYLALCETIICIYCYITQSFQFAVLVGFFLVLMIGSLEFYGKINNVEIDPNFTVYFLYTGISHILFGIAVSFDKHDNSTTADHTYY